MRIRAFQICLVVAVTTCASARLAMAQGMSFSVYSDACRAR